MTARARRQRGYVSIDGAKDYRLVDAVIDDLGAGQLDLARAGKRVREIYDEAFQAGAEAYANASADKIAQLAAENRQLRIRLVQQSLADDQAVA